MFDQYVSKFSKGNNLERTEKPLGVTLNIAAHKSFELFWLMILL
jgi:hypothetical protein